VTVAIAVFVYATAMTLANLSVAAFWARLTVRRPRAATKENCCD